MFRGSSRPTRESVSKRLPFEGSPLKNKDNRKGLSPKSKISPLKKGPPPKSALRNAPFQSMSPKTSRLRRTGRITTNRDKERFDITKMNTMEMNDLLDGVDVNGKDEALQKKEDNLHKKKSENKLLEKVIDIDSIYQRPQQQAKTVAENSGENKQARDHTAGSGDKEGTISLADGTTAARKEEAQDTPLTPKETQQNVVDDDMSETERDITTVVTENSNGIPQISSGTSGEILADTILQDSQNNSVLDATMPLFESQMTQTNEVLIYPCSCGRCSAVVKDFFKVMVSHKMLCAASNATAEATDSKSQVPLSPSTPNISAAHSGTSNKSADNEEEEKQVVLVRHCPQVKIPLSKKVAISVEVPDQDPQKLVHYLLDCLFTTEQLAGMTCDGKTENSVPLEKDIARILEIYVDNKYDSKKFNFNNRLFKHYVNTKCNKARNWVWKHCPELVGKTVRPKLQKNVKKEGNDNHEPKKRSTTYKEARFKVSPLKHHHKREGVVGDVNGPDMRKGKDRLRDDSGKKSHKEKYKGNSISFDSDDGKKKTRREKVDEHDHNHKIKKYDRDDSEYGGNKRTGKNREDDDKKEGTRKTRDDHDRDYDSENRGRKRTGKNREDDDETEGRQKRRRDDSKYDSDNKDRRINAKRRGETDNDYQEGSSRRKSERDNRSESDYRSRKKHKDSKRQDTDSESDQEQIRHNTGRGGSDNGDRSKEEEETDRNGKVKGKNENGSHNAKNFERRISGGDTQNKLASGSTTEQQKFKFRPSTGQKQPKDSILKQYEVMLHTSTPKHVRKESSGSEYSLQEESDDFSYDDQS